MKLKKHVTHSIIKLHKSTLSLILILSLLLNITSFVHGQKTIHPKESTKTSNTSSCKRGHPTTITDEENLPPTNVAPKSKRIKHSKQLLYTCKIQEHTDTLGNIESCKYTLRNSQHIYNLNINKIQYKNYAFIMKLPDDVFSIMLIINKKLYTCTFINNVYESYLSENIMVAPQDKTKETSAIPEIKDPTPSCSLLTLNTNRTQKKYLKTQHNNTLSPRQRVIIFHPNDNTKQKMDDQPIIPGVNQQINENTFNSPKGKFFSCWNTKQNGHGKNYFDGEMTDDIPVEDELNIHLWAQWDKIGVFDLSLGNIDIAVNQQTYSSDISYRSKSSIQINIPFSFIINIIQSDPSISGVVTVHNDDCIGDNFIDVAINAISIAPNANIAPFHIKDNINIRLTIIGKNFITSTMSSGISIGSNSNLKIIASVNDALTVTGGNGGCGIGPCKFNNNIHHSSIYIKGGNITAIGGPGGSGIYSNYDSGCNVNITGGTIKAQGGIGASGIGGVVGKNGGITTICGGKILAIGGNGQHIPDKYSQTFDGGAGIGGGGRLNIGKNKGTDTGGITNITGGTVVAFGGTNAVGIGAGGGDLSNAFQTYISGGSVWTNAVAPVTIHPIYPTIVYPHVLILDNILSQHTPINNGTATGYGIRDIFAIEDNKVCFWLPM